MRVKQGHSPGVGSSEERRAVQCWRRGVISPGLDAFSCVPSRALLECSSFHRSDRQMDAHQYAGGGAPPRKTVEWNTCHNARICTAFPLKVDPNLRLYWVIGANKSNLRILRHKHFFLKSIFFTAECKFHFYANSRFELMFVCRDLFAARISLLHSNRSSSN